jgi:hypothetical protein
MYGKFTKEEYMTMLHTNEQHYEMLTKKFRLEGGVGHVLYKIHGKNQSNDVGLAAAALSKRYYAYFRAFPHPPEAPDKLQADIDKFKSANKKAFEH